MTKIRDYATDRFLFEEGPASATPGTGELALYAKTDGALYVKDDAGVETAVGGGGGGSGDVVGPASSVAGHLALFDDTTGKLLEDGGAYVQAIIVAASDETTDLTTGTAKAKFRMPYAFTLTAVRASVSSAPTGSVLTVDINESGATILSTKITIDAGETTSTTAAIPPVISDTALADDAEISIDIDTIGSTLAGAGLKVALIGRPT